MTSSQSVKQLLDELEVLLDKGPFKVYLYGFREIIFYRTLPKEPGQYAPEVIHYEIQTVPRRVRVRVKVYWQAQEPSQSKVLTYDCGDLAVMSMRKRMLKAVKERNWQLLKIVEKDLEFLATAIPYYLKERERLLLGSITRSDGENQQYKAQLEEAKTATYSKGTMELVDLLDRLPAQAVPGQPSQASFTLRQLCGKTGWTIDRARHRFSAIERQPFIEVVQAAKSNRPTVFRYLPERRLAASQASPKVVNPLRRESEELVRYGEIAKKYRST